MANGVSITTRWLYEDELAYGPYAENTWHFSYNPIGATAISCAEAGRDALVDFWVQDVVHKDSLSNWLANSLSGICEFSYVDWEDEDNVSVPMDQEGFNTGTDDALPNEVALCLSFRCNPYGGHRRQSFYNRVYLGPLITTTNTSITPTGPGRPSGNFRDDVLAAYQKLQDSLDVFGPDVARHVVYSPTHDSSGIVTSAWVDDAWDTQRRRGVEPTEKNYWDAPPA